MNESQPLQSRLSALKTLTRVLSDGAFLDEALEQVPPHQRAWVHEVVAGTLRWKGRIDWIIDQLVLKKRPTGAVRKVLEMAVYQLLNQPQVQPAWIVSESVALTRKREGDAASSFVNAILRRIVDQLDAWKGLPFPESDPSLQWRWASLPEWLWFRMRKDHGLEWAKDYALRSLERPKTWIRSRKPVERTVPGSIPEAFSLEEWWPIHQSEGYRVGELFVQDLSSQQLIFDFCNFTEALIPNRPRRILDLCAAPGGKSAGLAWNGWSVIATDRVSGEALNSPASHRRFELLESTAARIRAEVPIRALPRDQAFELARVEGLYDAVWVDAPCTGSGVIRRHPEIRWLKGEKDLESLKAKQRELITEGVSQVRIGGYLMYSVCSVLREELEAALALETQTPRQFEKVREWLLSGEGDGFSAVLLRRIA